MGKPFSMCWQGIKRMKEGSTLTELHCCNCIDLVHNGLSLLDGSDINEFAIKGDCAKALCLCLLHRLQHPPRLSCLSLRGAVDLVGNLNLAWVNCPLSVHAKCCTTLALCP